MAEQDKIGFADWERTAMNSPEVTNWYKGMIQQDPKYKNIPMLDVMNQQKEQGIYDYQKAIESGNLPSPQSDHGGQYRWGDIGKLQQHPNLYNQDTPKQDMLYLAGMIYGEGASLDYDGMKMIGSSAINRLKSGRTKEFGSNMAEVLRKGYYAVSNPNEPYKEVMAGKFANEKNTEKYKQALAIAGGLTRGTIEPDEGLFYFTPKEEAKLRKTPKKFDFSQVEPVGKVGGYNTYKYK